MIVYAESSAVLSWLLGEPPGDEVRRALEAAEFVVTSDLTLVECDRAFHRAQSLGELSAERFAELRSELRRVAAGWVLLRLSDEIVERAREAFPEDPIRSLDALHLASVLSTVALVPETSLLTHDVRVRRCALALGLRLLPPPT
ncbi:MAG TPA: type II toxin-antitoxin system VapC family toxin [Thermoanaerobaculia bacterium]|jgi:predicted nucleic acid-binding protein